MSPARQYVIVFVLVFAVFAIASALANTTARDIGANPPVATTPVCPSFGPTPRPPDTCAPR